MAENKTVNSKSTKAKATSKKGVKDSKKVKDIKSGNTKIQQQLEKLTEERDTLKDQLLRKMAEFENYKNTTSIFVPLPPKLI